jgi:hypothetical protein
MNTGLAFQSQNQQIISNGLIAYWSFNEGSGSIGSDIISSNVRDYSGNNYTGSIVNLGVRVAPTWRPGQVGTTINMNSSDTGPYTNTNKNIGNYIKILRPTVFNLQRFSIMGWYNMSSLNVSSVINSPIDCSHAASGWSLNFNQSGSGAFRSGFVAFYWFTGSNAYNLNAGGAQSLFVGSWNHIAVTYDGTVTGTNLYVNSVATNQSTHTPTAITYASNPLYLGYDTNSGNGQWYWGKMDEIRIYNRSLSASEILTLYNARGT